MSIRSIRRESLHALLLRWRSGTDQAAARLVGRLPSHTLRLAAYRRVLGMSIGRATTIYRAPVVLRASGVRIGRTTIIGRDTVLDGRGGLTIGDNVNLSPGAWVWTMQHDKDSPDFAPDAAPVVIEDRAWLSSRTTVLPGVTIGEGAVVAAGAVVTDDVAPYSVVAGTPARKIGVRNRDLTYTLDPAVYRIPLA